jgi:Leucine-rich repeat (LRR) protein
MKKNGSYNPESFKTAYSNIDKNDDGKINRDELVTAVLKVAKEHNMYEEMVAKPIEKRSNIPPPPKIEQLTGDNAALFKEGLMDLGKTFNNARHAFLTLSINEKSLSNLDGIHRFRFLQNIYMRGNNLSNLQCLSALKHLVRLDASKNQITRMLDFDPPACLDWVDYSHN